MNELTRYIQEEVAWYMFADNITLVDETRKELVSKIERWKKVLESKDLELVEQRGNICSVILAVLQGKKHAVQNDGHDIPQTSQF